MKYKKVIGINEELCIALYRIIDLLFYIGLYTY